MKTEAKPGDTLGDLRALLREKAEEAPPRSGSLYETVRDLLPEIGELKAKRYNDADIVELLSTKGVVMSLGTFRQYVQRAKRETEGTETKPPRERKAKADANASTNAAPKPSELAGRAPAKAATGKPNFSHRLNDDDV